MLRVIPTWGTLVLHGKLQNRPGVRQVQASPESLPWIRNDSMIGTPDSPSRPVAMYAAAPRVETGYTPGQIFCLGWKTVGLLEYSTYMIFGDI